MVPVDYLLIQGAVMFAAVLIAVIFFLRYELKTGKLMKFVPLICAVNGTLSWKIFDTAAETNAFIEKKIPKDCVYSIIKTTNTNKHVSNGS